MECTLRRTKRQGIGPAMGKCPKLWRRRGCGHEQKQTRPKSVVSEEQVASGKACASFMNAQFHVRSCRLLNCRQTIRRTDSFREAPRMSGNRADRQPGRQNDRRVKRVVGGKVFVSAHAQRLRSSERVMCRSLAHRQTDRQADRQTGTKKSEPATPGNKQ